MSASVQWYAIDDDDDGGGGRDGDIKSGGRDSDKPEGQWTNCITRW